MTICIRIENQHGEGIYYASDARSPVHRLAGKDQPSPYGDLAGQVWDSHPNARFGFISENQFNNWFPMHHREHFAYHWSEPNWMRVAIYKARELLAASAHQCVFMPDSLITTLPLLVTIEELRGTIERYEDETARKARHVLWGCIRAGNRLPSTTPAPAPASHSHHYAAREVLDGFTPAEASSRYAGGGVLSVASAAAEHIAKRERIRNAYSYVCDTRPLWSLNVAKGV